MLDPARSTVSMCQGSRGKELRYSTVSKQLKRIRKDRKHRVLVLEIRRARSAGKEGRAKRLKDNLESVIWSGEFKDRAGGKVLQHSGLVYLDLDLADSAESRERKKLLSKHPKCFAVWRSVGGSGLGILAKVFPVPKTSEEHEEAYRRAVEDLGADDHDKSCKNIARLNFLSSDRKLVVNEDSAHVFWTLMPKEQQRKPRYRKLTEDQVERKVAEKLSAAVKGERHDTLISSAVYAIKHNDWSVEQFVSLAVALRPDKKEKEIRKTAEWASTH